MAAPLFQPGWVVATPGALALLEEVGESPARLLRRHLMGDWGEVPSEDARESDLAVHEGLRILSSYPIGDAGSVCIITEANRSSTCILLPGEYWAEVGAYLVSTG